MRCCHGCRAAARTGICSRCQIHKKITARTLDGQPLCHQCMRQDPINHEPCSRCGQTRPVQIRRDGQAVCPTCYRPPVAVCSICGKTKPCLGASTSTPRCEPCTRRLGSRPDCSRCGKPRLVGGRTADGQPLCHDCARPPEPCATCGRNRYVQGRTTNGEPLCRRCYPKHPVAQRRCTACGNVSRLHHHGLCSSCACTQQLRLILSNVDGVIRTDLEPVFEALRRQPPLTVLAWLRSPGPRALLAGLACDSGPVTHATLDRLAVPARTVAHLRGILASAGALPQRDEYLAALEHWILKATARITDPDERALVRQFAAWHHLRRLRNRTQRTGPTTYTQAEAVRREIRAAIALLAWLRARGSRLSICGQADIDTWLTDGPGLRHTARSFLRWAVARRHAPAVEIPAPPRDAVPPFIAHDRRWSLLRRLLHNTDIDLADRVAGLLVLLFAQPCSRIARLTTDHIQLDDTHVTLTLGTKPVQLPPPVDDLLTQLVQRRRGTGTGWLFPGAVAGQPFNAEQLTRRLNAIGVRVRAARNTTMIDLAGDVPAVVLSHLLGLHVRTTTDWVRIAGAPRAEYAADISQRETSRKL